MQQITLKKKHFAGGSVYLTPGWISNGHWAIKRTWIKNNAVFASADTVSAFLGEKTSVTVKENDSMVESILDTVKDAQLDYVKTDWVHSKAGDDFNLLRVFKNCSGKAVFREDYIQAFEILSLVGTKPTDVFRSADSDFLLMPCRLEDKILNQLDLA
ncbi:MAG TPA: hypothetical protein VGK99_03940 [Acidobacteriota bacterium]|jgi:hypothetical protein